MDVELREQLIRDFLEKECLPLLRAKGTDYARGTEDANANFYRIAEVLKDRGLDVFDVWCVYAHKHWDAIMSWVGKRKLESNETLTGRIVDMINYLLILHTLLVDRGATVKDSLFLPGLEEYISAEQPRQMASSSGS